RFAVIVITSDRGLAGAYNTAIIRKAVDFIKAQTGAEARLIAVGRKANQFFTRRHYSMAFNHSVPSAGARLEDAIEVSRVARQMFESGEVDAIYVCYSKFYSAIRQVPQVVPLLPIVAPEGAEAGVSGEYKFEPSPEALLNVLLPRYLLTLIQQSLFEGTASEFGARMTAMTSATDNAGKMIQSLTLRANRERQAAITKEILEVVGGAEALKA